MEEELAVPVFYADLSEQSAEAEVALQKAHVHFQKLVISNPLKEGVNVPQLLSTRGFFDTLDGIRWYARIYGRNGHS
jgi:hypothetical protein